MRALAISWSVVLAGACAGPVGVPPPETPSVLQPQQSPPEPEPEPVTRITPEALPCAVAEQLETARVECDAAERSVTPAFALVSTMSIQVAECSGEQTCFAVGHRTIGVVTRPPQPTPELAACMKRHFDALTSPPPTAGTHLECRHSMMPEGSSIPMLRRLEQAPEDACASGHTRCWVRPEE
ncbi:MAG: hypothetical protein ACRBN8_30715 [Nannocystales bacterium]